jgi:hypothetical protein
MAAALLMLDGLMGLRGWQILFFVEVGPRIVHGVVQRAKHVVCSNGRWGMVCSNGTWGMRAFQ